MNRTLLAVSLVLSAPLYAQSGPTSTFPNTNFAATHNSYSGNISGARGTISAQLTQGVRFIEYDINLGNFSSNKDYQIGHGSPGHQVDHTPPNPQSNNLADWLQMLAAWSDQNPGHAPITLGLDSKDDLSGQSSPADGNPSFLNNELQQYLGARMYTPVDLGSAQWPAWSNLKGKIIVVLSGNQTNRKHYRSDQGLTPAVAVNASGTAIVVYQSTQSSNLWYWYGNAQGGGFSWPVHGQYDTGVTPAVAINDQGTIVEVHKSETTSKIYSRVGVFKDGQVQWGDSQKVGTSGSMPSVAWTGSTVTQINLDSKGNAQRVTGTVNVSGMSIQWSSPASTSNPRYPTSSATAGAYTISVSNGSGPGGVANTLFYTTPAVSNGRIVYPQIMYTEYQKGDSAQLEDDQLWFYASSSSDGNWSWDISSRASGKIVRMWDFEQDDTQVASPPNFPATNTPKDSWYTEYCATNACQQ